jgi:hypothetical protein
MSKVPGQRSQALSLPFGAAESGFGVASEGTRSTRRLASQGIAQERAKLNPGPMQLRFQSSLGYTKGFGRLFRRQALDIAEHDS